MAWAVTVSGATIVGNKRKRWGTFSNTSGTSGGTITTGLGNIETYVATVTTNPADFSSVTFAKSGGNITVTATEAVTGDWEATGI